jgi:hypothetical protein
LNDLDANGRPPKYTFKASSIFQDHPTVLAFKFFRLLIHLNSSEVDKLWHYLFKKYLEGK